MTPAEATAAAAGAAVVATAAWAGLRRWARIPQVDGPHAGEVEETLRRLREGKA